MGWRLGAGWALIGFAAQCFLSLVAGEPFASGMKSAMVHYAAWGIAGFLVGAVMEGILEDAFRRIVEPPTKNQTLSSQDRAAEPSSGPTRPTP